MCFDFAALSGFDEFSIWVRVFCPFCELWSKKKSQEKMFNFLSILLASIVAYILRFHYEYVRQIYLSMKIAGPHAIPIIGNGLMFINKTSAGIVLVHRNNDIFEWDERF